MFRYLTVLLLITAYSSSGLPVQNSVSVVSSLQQLSNHCENKFVSKKVLENLSYCNESMKLHSKKEIMCLMYYDINRQLCASKLSFDDDTNNKINEIQERKTLCGAAQTWTFGIIPEYPEYAMVANMIFKNREKCLGACAVVDDIVSDDSNYYCKYYNWGMSVLNQNQQITKVEPKANDILADVKPNNITITTSTVNNLSRISPDESSDNLRPPINLPSESSSVSVVNVSQKSDSPLAIPLPDVTSNKIAPKPEQEEPPVKVKEEEKETPKDIIEKPRSEDKEQIDHAQAKPQNFDMDEDQEEDGIIFLFNLPNTIQY